MISVLLKTSLYHHRALEKYQLVGFHLEIDLFRSVIILSSVRQMFSSIIFQEVICQCSEAASVRAVWTERNHKGSVEVNPYKPRPCLRVFSKKLLGKGDDKGVFFFDMAAKMPNHFMDPFCEYSKINVFDIFVRL